MRQMLMSPLQLLGEWALRRHERWMVPRRARIMEVLADGCWWYGADIRKASGGVLGHELYTVLREMEREGLVTSREEPWVPPSLKAVMGGLRRRLYRASPQKASQ